MKKYILILLLSITGKSFSQYTVTDKFDYTNNIERGTNGYYYKDVTGYFNQFLGTWQYQDATTTYILEFEKRTFTADFPHVNTTYKYDDLIGALKVIKNGVVIYDDLATLEQNYTSATEYNINSVIRVENYNNCYMCSYPEQRLSLSYNEPDNDNYAYFNLHILIHTYVENGVTKLRLVFLSDQVNPDSFFSINDSSLPPTKTQLYLGYGTFDFVKVP